MALKTNLGYVLQSLPHVSLEIRWLKLFCFTFAPFQTILPIQEEWEASFLVVFKGEVLLDLDDKKVMYAKPGHSQIYISVQVLFCLSS